MLAAEDFGRRHQRALRSGLDGVQQRQHRHHGLARADIALQQPQHAVGRGHVGLDLGQRLRLPVGEREGQGGDRFRLQTPVARDGAALRDCASV